MKTNQKQVTNVTTKKETVVNNTITEMQSVPFSPEMLLKQMSEQQNEKLNNSLVKLLVKNEMLTLNEEQNILQAVKYWKSLKECSKKDLPFLKSFFESQYKAFDLIALQGLNSLFNRLFVREIPNLYTPNNVRTLIVKFISLNNVNEWSKQVNLSNDLSTNVILPFVKNEITISKAIENLAVYFDLNKLSKVNLDFIYNSHPVTFKKLNLVLKVDKVK